MADLVAQLNQMKGYHYRVWEYHVSHSVLTILATHEAKPQQDFHLVFEGVAYLQLPLSWTGNLCIGPDKELFDILKRTNLFTEPAHLLEDEEARAIIRRMFTLYKAEANNSNIYILGKLNIIKPVTKPTQ